MTAPPKQFMDWAKLLSKFVSVQLIVQAISLVSGILLVRALSQQEYAFFTIANTMQSMMATLADMGISTSLSALGGKVWQDNYRFGQLINTAMWFRYRLAIVSVLVVTPILMWMLLQNGATPPYAAAITGVVLIGLNFQLTNGVLLVVPQLHSLINQIQNLELFSAVIRLLLLGLAYLTFLNSVLAVLVGTVITAIQRVIWERIVNIRIDRTALINLEDQKFMYQTVANIAPTTIFFCIQGQLSVFLISIFGNVNNVAEIGALGRLVIVFTIVKSVFSTILLPSFARCQSISILRCRYFQILGYFFLFCLIIIGVTAVYTDEVLWILGAQYAHLKSELLLMTIATTFSSFIGVMVALNHSKAWIKNIWIEIPAKITLQIALLLVLDVSSIKGVILLDLFSNVSLLLVNFMMAYRGLTEYQSANS